MKISRIFVGYRRLSPKSLIVTNNCEHIVKFQTLLYPTVLKTLCDYERFSIYLKMNIRYGGADKRQQRPLPTVSFRALWTIANTTFRATDIRQQSRFARPG